MALVFMDGFDKYGAANTNSTAVAAQLTAGEWTTVSGGVAIVSPLSATGFALSIASNSIQKTIPTVSRSIGGVRFSSNLATGVGGIQFRDGVVQQAAIAINTTGTVSVRQGAIASGTILGTSASSITANSTHYLEWDITFSNTGLYQVWMDGVSILSGSGDTTATANNFATTFELTGSGGNTIIVDDLYLFDTTGTTNNAVLLTSPRIETQFPTGDVAVQFAFGAATLGSSYGLTSTAAFTLANFLCLRRFIPVVSGTINSITFVPADTNGAALYRPVLYADSAGTAGALMSSGPNQTGITSGVAKVLPLTTPQSLVAGTPYWLGVMTDSSPNVYLLDGNNTGYRASATFSSGAPATAPALTPIQPTWLFWGNLTGVVGNNWYEIGRNPPQGNLSYVYDATVGHEDLYSFPSLSVPPTAIYAVAVKASLSKSDAGAKTASIRLKSAATDSAGTGGTALAPGTSYGWMTSHYERDPNGNIAWTQPNLNAAQAGVKVET